MSVAATPRKERVGAVRPSQLLHTYGVGALIDLPNISVIVAGLQAWEQVEDDIHEPRLLAAVRAILGTQVERLAAMPWKESTKNPKDAWASVGVPVLPFPRWMRCTGCNTLSSIDGGLFSLEASVYRPDRARYVHKGCGSGARSSPLAVPARFVTACSKGHLDEFPWVEYTHNFRPCPKDGGNLQLIERGSGTRSTDVIVKCTACEQSSVMGRAFERDASERPRCRGRHPHLRSFEGCDQPARTLLLGASNTWFAMTRSALAIPLEAPDPVDEEVESLWSEIAKLPIFDEAALQAALTFNPGLKNLKPFPLSDVWAAITFRRAGLEAPIHTDLKFPEWERFTDPAYSPTANDFTLERVSVPKAYVSTLEQVVAVLRLRQTTALVGFARIDPPDSGLTDDLEGVIRVPLTTKPASWVPAADVRGEGIFLQLPEEAVRAWEARVADSKRMRALRAAFVLRFGSKAWLGARYVLIHSFAHLLINELALECGYGAASLHERIYAETGEGGAGPMAGVLVYTAAADSEGTLGGLVSMANPQTLGRVIEAALRRTELCSSDPLCAEHVPTLDDQTLHGAACHSCLFLPETSCERNNRLLDRAVLVETLTESAVAYFPA